MKNCQLVTYECENIFLIITQLIDRMDESHILYRQSHCTGFSPSTVFQVVTNIKLIVTDRHFKKRFHKKCN